MLINDVHILGLLKEHNHRGLEMLFDSYYRPLVLWADSFLNDIPASEDLVQELFVAFWEKRLYSRLSTNNLKSYLFASVRNLSLNHLEKHDPLGKTVAAQILQLASVEPDDMLTEELLRAIEDEIEKLPPRSRAVLKAIYIDGLRYSEAAAKLGVTVATVKTLLVNALKKLREIFARYLL